MKLQTPFLTLMLLLAVVLLAPTIGTTKAMRFTAIPDQDSSRLQTRFSKVADYLSAELGFTITYIPVKSYAASVQAFT